MKHDEQSLKNKEIQPKKKKRHPGAAMQRSHKQTEINNDREGQENQLQKLARAKRRMGRNNIPRHVWRNSPPARKRGRWGNNVSKN